MPSASVASIPDPAKGLLSCNRQLIDVRLRIASLQADGITKQDHSVEDELRLVILNVPLSIEPDHRLADQDPWSGYP